MKELMKNELATNIVILIVGIILTIWPDATLDVAVNLVGSLVCLFGIVNIIMWFNNKGSYSSLFLGILALIIGIFIIVRSDVVISIMPILLGIAILADGITNLKSLYDVKSDSKSWKALFISAIITTILGLILIFRPLFIANMITRIGGIIMILCGIEGLFISHKSYKIVKR